LIGCIYLVSAGTLAAGLGAVIVTVHAVGADGLVCRSTGSERMLFQTRSPGGFIDWLLPRIPNNSN